MYAKLVKLEVNIKIFTESNLTPLHAAILSGDIEAALKLTQTWDFKKFLLLFARTVNVKNIQGDSPLLLAVKLYPNNPSGYQEILDALLKAGAITKIAEYFRYIT